jgi:hypothetical protein
MKESSVTTVIQFLRLATSFEDQKSFNNGSHRNTSGGWPGRFEVHYIALVSLSKEC